MIGNRLKDYFGEGSEESSCEEDYFVVGGEAGYFYVSRETAERVSQELARRRPPRWIVFQDLAGSEVRVRRDKVDAVYESTSEQRARGRAFNRARRLEDKKDRRPWEDDD
jgi:hypothetical protein